MAIIEVGTVLITILEFGIVTYERHAHNTFLQCYLHRTMYKSVTRDQSSHFSLSLRSGVPGMVDSEEERKKNVMICEPMNVEESCLD